MEFFFCVSVEGRIFFVCGCGKKFSQCGWGKCVLVWVCATNFFGVDVGWNIFLCVCGLRVECFFCVV